jgi:hypothetical protein
VFLAKAFPPYHKINILGYGGDSRAAADERGRGTKQTKIFKTPDLDASNRDRKSRKFCGLGLLYPSSGNLLLIVGIYDIIFRKYVFAGGKFAVHEQQNVDFVS